MRSAPVRDILGQDKGVVLIRLAVLLPLGVAVAGFVWILTIGTFFGALLVLGGVLALFVTMTPLVVDRIATFLSTGSLRKRWWE